MTTLQYPTCERVGMTTLHFHYYKYATLWNVAPHLFTSLLSSTLSQSLLFPSKTLRSFNPRPAGGHILTPSRIFAITSELRKILPQNFQYLIGHQLDTLSEQFSQINLVGTFLRKWRFSDVMSCDFDLKMVVSYIDRRSMYSEANRKQKVSKQRKLNSLQDGYLGLSKCLDFDPQKFKKHVFFWEKCF